MLSELRLLLASCTAQAGLEDYRAAAMVDNALLKKTVSTRRSSFRFLRELYALSPNVLLFRSLRDLWVDGPAQPLLALLCTAARDPILRPTADLILATPVGGHISPQMLSETVSKHLSGRYSKLITAKIGRNAASSWQQSGHLHGRRHKIRSKVTSSPAALAYALLLGHLCGVRGEALFHTRWCQLLDSPLHELQDQALLAAQHGYIDYRHAGSVTEISFRYLLRDVPVP